MIPTQRSKRETHGLSLPDRFGSCKATAPANLVHPKGGETDRKIAAPLAEKTDLIMHRAATERASSLGVRMEAWRRAAVALGQRRAAATSA